MDEIVKQDPLFSSYLRFLVNFAYIHARGIWPDKDRSMCFSADDSPDRFRLLRYDDGNHTKIGFEKPTLTGLVIYTLWQVEIEKTGPKIRIIGVFWLPLTQDK
jgi:hypothetical protein